MAQIFFRAWKGENTGWKEFTGFCSPALEIIDEAPEEDFVADDRAELYYISVDVDGEIGWAAYKAYLRWRHCQLELSSGRYGG